jgi:hypothetical protein
MPITPLPALDRTSATFRTDTDTFFGVQLPAFSVEVEAARLAIAAASTATGGDSLQTGLDRTQTGLDRTAAADSAATAVTKADEALASKDAAALSEANTLGYLQAYRATSYGALAADPALDPLGNAPTAGDEYFNTTSNLLKRYNGSAWQVPDINTTNLAAAGGSGMVGHDATLNYAVGTIGAIINDVTINVKMFPWLAKGDGVTDDRAAIQAAIDFAGEGGTIIFNRTASNKYCVSGPLYFYKGQTWRASGGLDVAGKPLEIRLTANASSVAEPKNPALTTYGFNPIGIYFNAQAFGDAGLSLYNTSYASVDQCAANSGKAGGAGILMDADTSKQCYFNKINVPRVFANGVGGVGIRFTRGANANQVFGGKCGSSTRGMEFLSLSSGNLVIGTDFEDNSDRHIEIDAPNNVFIGTHMESAPVGFNITALGTNTQRMNTTFATTTVINVQDASKIGTTLDTRSEPSGMKGDLRFGPAKFLSTYLSGGSTLDYDPDLVSGTSNALLRFFLTTNTTGIKQLILYKGDGTSTVSIKLDASNGQITHDDISQNNGGGGIYRQLLRRAAVPTTGAYSAGDKILRTNPSASAVVTEWTCTTTGTPGSWQATGWIVTKGLTAARPALTANDAGVQYFDTTLAAAGKPIFWTGTAWVDGLGVVV